MPVERRVILQEEQLQLDGVLREFLKNSEAKGALLVDLSGALICQQGFIQRFDTTSLAVLSAGTISSTKQMARVIGESLFTDLFLQGKRDHIYLSLVGSEAVMVVIFDNSTTLGLVRLYAKQAVRALRQVLMRVKSRNAKPQSLTNRPKMQDPDAIPSSYFKPQNPKESEESS